MKLENWGVIGSVLDPYMPPELQVKMLVGVVDDHPTLGKNAEIRSSRIEKVEGNKVTTYSGSVYELGTPHPEFVEFCKLNGVHVPTPEEPIKLV